MMQLAMEDTDASSSDVAGTPGGETLVPQILQFSIGQGNIHMAKHVRYFMSCLKGLTYHYAGNDLNRLMVAYFCVNALDMLGAIDKIPKRDIIEWIYALQVEPGISHVQSCGFRGSTFFFCDEETGDGAEYDHAHIAMSYTALASLRALGDDLSRVYKEALLASLAKLQQEDGSFLAYPDGGERDMRFVYCACAISALLDGDWRAVRKDRVVQYIRDCMCYDGGIALIPGQESHGGSTYCALASLFLMDPTLSQLSQDEKDNITAWCMRRQGHGFQGRCGKDADTCYSFWIGASLKLLGRFELVNRSEVRSFHVECQDNFYGGFSKYPDHLPDVLHAFYSVCFLSMTGEEGVRELDCALAICADRSPLTEVGTGKNEVVPQVAQDSDTKLGEVVGSETAVAAPQVVED